MFYADYIYTGNTEHVQKYYDYLKYKSLYVLSNQDGLITSTKLTPQLMVNLGFPKMVVVISDN
ncbi:MULTISPECIES: hypothetical protein [Arenibacter]|uniref:hypothetical protein n=1 Tax=Arenibacter TaxID=178469 RepID=UPI001963815B|nr:MULTISPECIES: hypothetical protein [Arenibacter]